MSRQKSTPSPRFRFTGAALLFLGLVFLVPALRDGNPQLYLLAAAVPCAVLLCVTLFARMFSLDRMLLSLSLFLCSAGIASLALSDPDSAFKQALCCGAGVAALLVGGVLIRSLAASSLASVSAAFLGFLLLAAKLLSPSLSLPLAEAAAALLLIAFCAAFSRTGPVSALLLGTAVLAVLLVRRDAVDAAVWGLTVLMLLFAADGRPLIVLSALAAELALFLGAFFLFPDLLSGGGALSLDALIAAGAVGADVLPEGLAASAPSLLPRLAGHYGLVFTGLVVLLYLPLTLRGTSVASVCRTRFHAMLAMGASLLIALRTLAAVLSCFGILDLPVLSVPLLTESLPDLCAGMFLVGLLCGVAGRNEADLAEDAHLAMLAD